jgi:hypothetical protein
MVDVRRLMQRAFGLVSSALRRAGLNTRAPTQGIIARAACGRTESRPRPSIPEVFS